jgi:hypothetical protein
MLCDKCLNRTICKYYAFFADAPMVVNIESCEKANFKTSCVKNNPNDNIALLNFKQPIDYSQMGIKEEKVEEEPGEKITVDLSECNEPEHVDIMDLLIGDDDNEPKES